MLISCQLTSRLDGLFSDRDVPDFAGLDSFATVFLQVYVADLPHAPRLGHPHVLVAVALARHHLVHLKDHTAASESGSCSEIPPTTSSLTLILHPTCNPTKQDALLPTSVPCLERNLFTAPEQSGASALFFNYSSQQVELSLIALDCVRSNAAGRSGSGPCSSCSSLTYIGTHKTRVRPCSPAARKQLSAHINPPSIR